MPKIAPRNSSMADNVVSMASAGKEYEPKMRAARNRLGGKYFVPNMSYNERIKDARCNPHVHPVDVPAIMP